MSAYWRIGVWGSETAFRHRYNEQEQEGRVSEGSSLCLRLQSKSLPKAFRLHGDGAKAGAFAGYSMQCLRVELKVEEKGEIKAHSCTNFGKYIARDPPPIVFP